MTQINAWYHVRPAEIMLQAMTVRQFRPLRLVRSKRTGTLGCLDEVREGKGSEQVNVPKVLRLKLSAIQKDT